MATRTTCPYCGVGCGVLATPDERGAAIAGDPEHPANFGRLCSKGSALGETLGLERRLLHPMARDAGGTLRRVDWDAAATRVANDLQRVIGRHGPDAVAFYLSGQLLSEDYYVANKLMKGFIGSPNVDTNSRLCMASTVAGHKRGFGADVVPGCYDDLDEADLLVLVGSNAAWCHPILFQRMQRNREQRGAKLVVIDPRRTATSEDADLFLGLAPGSDSALFSGLLSFLAKAGALDRDYVNRHTQGFDEALAAAQALTPTIAATARLTRLRETDIAGFFELFVQTPRVVTAFSQGVNQSAQGSDKVNAILNCHLATGRIGKPGASPFSLTGQPNAMGGREVGGLANQLAAHMGFDAASVDRARRFWSAPQMADREGLKAVQMFDAIARGEIKALWVMGTNPAVSLPDADAARAALKQLDLFIVSDNVTANDTIDAGAHILLPALAWGEKDGTVTNSERRISRQRAFLGAPADARADWAIVSDVARRMGFAGFDYRSAADVFREHAALSAFENDGARAFDIGALKNLSDAEFDALAPTQWPAREGESARERLFAEGGFFTPDRRARFVAPQTPELKTSVSQRFPLRLNTGRVRDHWHTMTRTGLSPRLARHLSEPFVEVHPQDASAFRVKDKGFARVETLYGAATLRVVVTESVGPGQIFAPIHWSDATAAQGRVGALVAPHTDPVSGQPEAKATPARLAPRAFAYEGYLLARGDPPPPRFALWTRVALHGATGYRFAANAAPAQWRAYLREIYAGDDVIEYMDDAQGAYRAAAFVDDRPELALFVGRGATAPAWDAPLALFSNENLTARQRALLLSGRAASGAADSGPIVCACFGVGANRIAGAIAEGCQDAAAIGAKLRAGTNCGSCLPEIKRMLSLREAAE
jgi:assimilatory nitrate reductase catalytic subunit